MIRRTKQAARQRPAPDDARLIGIACCKRPDARGAPVDRPPPHILLFVTFGLGRIGRNGDLLPAAAVLAMEFHSKMTMIECRIGPPVAPIGQRERDVVAEEIERADIPAAAVTGRGEQAFAARY